MTTVRRPSSAQQERKLSVAVSRWRRARQGEEQARAARDDAIREALEAGMPRAQITDITGFHASRIDQIRRDSRV